MVVLVFEGVLVLHAGVTQRWLSGITGGSSLVDLLSGMGMGRWCWWCWCGGAYLSCEVVPYEIVGGRALEAQGLGERPPSLCEIEATRVGVQVCPSARQPMTRIRNELGRHADEIGPDRHDA
jgi:hypothetical protein